MRKEREGHIYPAYTLRPSRNLAEKYLASQGAPVELSAVPSTYMIFLRGEARGIDLFQDLDIPRNKALLGGQRYEWFAPIGWDDDVQVTTTVLKIVEKTTKSGPLWIADVQYDYTLASTRQLAVRELTRIIKRS